MAGQQPEGPYPPEGHRAMQTENTTRPPLRACVKLVCFYLLAIGLLFLGWDGWTDGSVRIHPKHAEAYTATRGGENEGEFYLYVVGSLVIGAFLLLVNVILTWKAFFSRDVISKANTLQSLNTPFFARGPRIPAWLFWGVIAVFVGTLVRACISMH